MYTIRLSHYNRKNNERHLVYYLTVPRRPFGFAAARPAETGAGETRARHAFRRPFCPVHFSLPARECQPTEPFPKAHNPALWAGGRECPPAGGSCGAGHGKGAPACTPVFSALLHLFFFRLVCYTGAMAGGRPKGRHPGLCKKSEAVIFIKCGCAPHDHKGGMPVVGNAHF